MNHMKDDKRIFVYTEDDNIDTWCQVIGLLHHVNNCYLLLFLIAIDCLLLVLYDIKFLQCSTLSISDLSIILQLI